MTPSPVEIPPRPRSRWFKRLFIATVVIVLLLGLLALGGWVYLRSEKFNRYVAGEIKAKLSEFGLRAEIGGFGLGWDPQTARLRDLKIYNQRTGQLVATIKRADTLIAVRDPFALKFSREIAVKKIDIEGVDLYFEIDRKGQTNWDGVRYAPPKSEAITFDTASLFTSLAEGAVHFKDLSRKIEAEVREVKATAQPQAGNPNVIDLRLASGSGRVVYEGREDRLDKLDLVARVSETGAEIESLNLKSNAADAQAKGRLDDWTELRYDFSFDSRVKLDEASRIFALATTINGVAAINGRVAGKSANYNVKGVANSNEVTVADARLFGLQIPFGVEGKGSQVNFSGNQIRAESLASGAAKLNAMTIDKLKGEYGNGAAQIEADAKVAAIEWPEGKLADLALDTITASFSGDKYEGKANVALSGGEVRGAKFGDTTAQAAFDDTALNLSGVKSNVYGGTVEAEYVLPLAGGAAQHLTARFAGVETKSAPELFGIKDLPISGKIRGEADLSFVGANPRTISGSITTHFDGKSSEATDALPLTGEVKIKVASGVFNFDQLELATDASKLIASGKLSIDGDSDLRFAFNSTQADQLIQIARAFERARPYIEQYEPQLIGNLRLEGRVTGQIEKAAIEAKVEAETFGLRDALPSNSLSGRVFASPTEARVEAGLITASNGGSVKFDLTWPFDKNATSGALNAALDRISLETLLAASGLPSANQFISGDISGEAHLTGLPAAIEGDAQFNLIDGKIADQPAQAARAEIRLEGKDALLEELEVRLSQSRILANGSMNLEDYAFQLGGKADQISLENLANAFELKQTRIEGAANADFDIIGKVITGKEAGLDWESLRVKIEAQGKDVKVDGRDAGELKLTAQTSPGGRLDAELTTGLLAAGGEAGSKGQAEPIKAAIELRQPGRPVTIESDLTRLDIAPLLAIFAPDLNSTIKGTINGKLRIAGPSVDEQGNATFDRLRGGLTLSEVALTVLDNPVRIERGATIALENSQIKIPGARIAGEGAELSLGGAIGLGGESAMNFTLNGSVNFDRLPALTPDLLLFGAMTIDARLTGSFAEPQLNGKVALNGFGLSSSDPPIFISNGAGNFTLAGDQVKLERFTADANDGRVEITGQTKLERLRPKEWRYDITAANAVIAYREVTATVDGDLSLAGTPEGQTLSGQVTVPQAEYLPSFDIDNLALGQGAAPGFAFDRFSGPAFSPDPKRFGVPPVKLNVRVEARDSLIIRNDQINTVGTAILALSGSITNPDPNGLITLDGGTWRFRGQRYEITTGSLDLPPTGSSAPLLNLLAEGELSGYRVNIGLIGPLDDLDLTLRSEPPLTRDEILSLIATGRTEAGTLSGQDPLRSGVGTAASLVSSGLISKPTEQLLGLSRFQIDPIIRPNLDPAARLTLGQQFSRNLYLSYATNLASERDQTALAEYTLSNRFSALATYTQGGGASRLGLREEGVFTIELRGRQRFSLGFRPERTTAPGAPTDALTRIVRPKLPPAQVKVSETDKLKLSERKLRELLPVVQQGFSPSLMRLGERRLREYLQESGYFFAEVKSRCEPENCRGDELRVFYDVQPNAIYDLKEIRLEGSDLIKLKDLRGELQSQTANELGGTPFLKDLPFVSGYVRGLTSNDRLNNDEELIRRRLLDMGYRNARVKSRLAFRPDNDDLVVIFDLAPGEQSEFADVRVRGNVTAPASELFAAIPVQSGDAFSFTQAQRGAQQIRQFYAQRGFLEATVEAEFIELDSERVRLAYNIVEGARAVVTRIEINGTTKTGQGWVRRYLDFKPGDVLTPPRIRRTQRDLYATNAFREVSVRAEPMGGDDGGAHRVMVNLTEAKPLLFVYGLGYSTDDGARGLAEIANTNLGGTLDSLSLRLRGSRRDRFAQISFTDPRPFGLRTPTTVSVFYNRSANLRPFVRRQLVGGEVVEIKQEDLFGVERFAAFIQTERKLGERTSLRFRYNLERARLFNDERIPETAITRNERSIRLGMFSIGVSRDTRDSVLNPTGGQLFSADHSIAARIFGGTESFNKFFATYQRYKTLDQFTPLLGASTLAFSARLGLAAIFRPVDRDGDGMIDASDRRLPISERFFSGGATTLRGFKFETAGPQIVLENKGELPALVPSGGDALAIFNFELRYPLTRRLRLVPFYDLGNVFGRARNFNFSGMTHTVGLGLRINTPLGPIGVDYGFLIDPPSFFTLADQNGMRATLRQPRGAIHIRFGQTF
jgi:outer membrane protein assembly complex protein YaeT